MADQIIEGSVAEGDAAGVGTSVVIDPSSVARVCFLQNTIEEIVSFLAAQYAIAEDAGELTISFARLNPRQGKQLEFEVITEPGTAQPNLNYLPADGPFIFLEGETFIERTIRILNASIGEGVSKAFTLTIAAAPSRVRYARGPVSKATVTIDGAGVMGQNGFLQFSAPSVSIPENAGTATATVQVTRTGSVAPGAAQVTVTSSNGTAVTPTHYTTVAAVLNWGVGDVSAKPVPVTVVNVGTAQGDTTLQLSLSGATGAQIGALSTQTVSILDLTPPSGPLYPLTAGMHIGDPHDNASSAFLDKASLQDFVIIGVLPVRGMAYYQTAAAALKTRNPAIKVFLYWDPYFARGNSSANQFTNSLIDYYRTQTGVPGMVVGANEWLAQDSNGNQIQRALYGTSYYPNFHPSVQSDGDGRKCFAYTLQWLKEHILDAVPSADGLYLDDTAHRDAEWAGSWVYQLDNVNVGTNDAAKRVSYRAGLKLGFDHWKNITSKLLLANCGGWTLETANAVPIFSQYQLDGITFEQRIGTNIATFGLRTSGNNVINNGVGNFATGKSRIDHALFSTQNFRTRTPPFNIFIVSGMPAANRNSSAGRSAGHRLARYFMGLTWVCSDMYLHGHDQAGGDLKSYEADPGVMAEYDEYWGESTAGLSFLGKLSKRKWMGAPSDPKAATPTQLGCYRRRFENAEVWVNPEANGTRTLTLGAAPAGKVRRLISGSQDPSVNTGAAVGATFTLSDQNGIVFRLDNA